MKLPFFSLPYLLAQVRARANIMLVKHYDRVTDTLTAVPKISLVVNAIKFACS